MSDEDNEATAEVFAQNVLGAVDGFGENGVDEPKNVVYEFFGLICLSYLLWSVPLADLVRFHFFFLSYVLFLDFF